MENEVRILSSLSHPHIIMYHCSFQVGHSGEAEGGARGFGVGGRRAGDGGRRRGADQGAEGRGRWADPSPRTTGLLPAQDEGNLNIVMEFASRGNVEEAIKRRQATRFPFAELTVLSWMRQLGGALQHMHSMQILHRDLKVCMPYRLQPRVLEAATLSVLERLQP